MILLHRSDAAEAYVGSANLTHPGWVTNVEVGLTDSEAAVGLSERFEQWWRCGRDVPRADWPVVGQVAGPLAQETADGVLVHVTMSAKASRVPLSQTGFPAAPGGGTWQGEVLKWDGTPSFTMSVLPPSAYASLTREVYRARIELREISIRSPWGDQRFVAPALRPELDHWIARWEPRLPPAVC